jgi:hypothetical protein
MQREWYVADRVTQVEADAGTRAMRRTSDAREIKELAGAVLHAWPEHQCQARGVGGDALLDVLGTQ